MLAVLSYFLTASLIFYFMYIDINMMIGKVILLSVVIQLVYWILLKISNKYLQTKTKDIVDDILGISLFIGGIMAIIIYLYHLINHSVLPIINYFYYVYIFISNTLMIPTLWNKNIYKSSESSEHM